MHRKVLLVDGYNVIRSEQCYRDLIDDDIRDPFLHDVYIRARQALIADVAAFAQGAYDRTTIVFDGFGNSDPDRRTTKSAGIDIIFSPSGVEADAIIERLACSARLEGDEACVITSDARVQSTVFAQGVTRLSARMFGNEAKTIHDDVKQLRFVPDTGVAARATVADRISADTRAQLRALLDACEYTSIKKNTVDSKEAKHRKADHHG